MYRNDGEVNSAPGVSMHAHHEMVTRCTVSRHDCADRRMHLRRSEAPGSFCIVTEHACAAEGGALIFFQKLPSCGLK